ncbi:MAG: DUF2147 domain-containing protein [Francisellaceae bacterium]
MKKLGIYGVVLGLVTMPVLSLAIDKAAKEMNQSPVGYWLQYSDDGIGQSVMEVMPGAKNTLEGKILVPFVNIVDDKIVAPDVACKECGKGSKNGYSYDYTKMPEAQVQDLKIMWSFTKDSDADGSQGPVYDDGSILDPSDGKVYSCKMYTTDYGKWLNVRGYIGFSLFGRTQTWQRISQDQAEHFVKMCGLTKEGHYTYTDKNGKIVNQALWEACSHVNLKDKKK